MQRQLRDRCRWAVVPLLIAGLAALALDRPAIGQNPEGDQPNLLTRGPIHEAFAEPITFNPKPGPLAPRQPPANIEELPPDQRPEGDNVAWVPGYWQWDEEPSEFLWVSGFWRVIPPGRQWIPGYWDEANGAQWQWVSGYWAMVEQQEVEYLPEPPASVENGPVTPQPSTNHSWVPGNWVYQETRYLWQPGYWIVPSPGWIWVPASYVWSPVGFVYVPGYWDYSIRRRGMLFAPFYYQAAWVRPGWAYRPMVCIDVDIVTAHFWCRPRFRHYYFGDYYGATYASVGFTPWFNFTYARGGFCPIYSYHAWYFRGRDPRWEAGLRSDFQFRFAHVDARPPRTFVQQQVFINNINTTVVNNNVVNFNRTNVQNLTLARPMNQVVTRANTAADAPIRFQRLDAEQVRQASLTQQELRRANQQRMELERAAAARLRESQAGAGGPGRPGDRPGAGGDRPSARPPTPTAPIRIEAPRTPIAARPMPPTGDAAGSPGAGAGGPPGRPSRVPPPRPDGGGRPRPPVAGSPAPTQPAIITPTAPGRPGGMRPTTPGGVVPT
ncbi:MAG TPA: hypothetical protein PKD86_12440, partial [Gemmatales bacterium]|nr:hypothetical protein [Gemmatales bacterium]